MSENYAADPQCLDRGADRPHVVRYLIARGFIGKGDVVVDGACGYGYGSALLAEVAKKVYSFDHHDIFQPQWKRDNIEFKVVDLEKELEFPSCDVFVSIETIEHLDNPQYFLDRIAKATKRIIVISSPDKPTVGLTEWHKTDVMLGYLEKMMEKYHPEWKLLHDIKQGYCYMAFYIKGNKTF